MDCSQLIESLDSLWFFSNVLSSRAQNLGTSSDESETTSKNHAKESIKEEPSTPMSPIFQNESQNDVLVSQKCLTCGEFAPEIEPIIVQPFVSEVVEFAKTPEKEEKRRRRKKYKRSNLEQRRMILGELDLSFESTFSGSWEKYEYQRFGGGGGGQHDLKMPPLNDGMAMKEHLKSWAYAVACTVK